MAQDVELVEELLGVELGPRTEAQELHQKRTTRVKQLLNQGGNPRHEVEESARLRKSLG